MKRTLILFCFLSFLGNLLAVTGYPGLIRFTQPDGSELEISMKGDEKVHWAETPDGYTIIFNSNGFYEYAMLDDNNDLVASGIRAQAEAMRSRTEQNWLANLPKHLRYSTAQQGIMRQIWDVYERESRAFPTIGERRLICVLIGFPDLPFTKSQAQFNDLFNQVGYSYDGAVGSVKDYFLEMSYGQLNLITDVVGPFVSADNMNTYRERANVLCLEAINQADPSVDFSLYDNGDDGYMDGIYMIYAGYGWHAGGPDGSIWAHAGLLAEPITRDGVIIHRYACSSELRSNSGTGIERIGTICHEFGHVLGAPDYYDTNGDEGGGDFTGLGDWCLMASGNWNFNSGVSPAHINGFAKVHVYNWADFNLMSVPTVTTLSNSVQYSDSFYKYNTATANEYFVLENRQQIGFDAHLPGEGMIIYHVHSEYQQGQSANNLNQTHPQKMYIVSQNASVEPNSAVSSYGEINTASCAWNGTGKTVFSDYTVPSSKSWAGEDTNQPISNISGNQQNRTISFSFRDADPEGYLWTGALGTDWHNPGNWADNTVPDPSHDVVIPANVSFFPSIGGADAYCKNLYLVPGSELGIGNANLMVYEDIESFGNIILATASSAIFAARDVTWGSNAELTVVNAAARIYCKRGMTFAEGSNIQTTLGSIIFSSPEHTIPTWITMLISSIKAPIPSLPM